MGLMPSKLRAIQTGVRYYLEYLDHSQDRLSPQCRHLKSQGKERRVGHRLAPLCTSCPAGIECEVLDNYSGITGNFRTGSYFLKTQKFKYFLRCVWVIIQSKIHIFLVFHIYFLFSLTPSISQFSSRSLCAYSLINKIQRFAHHENVI